METAPILESVREELAALAEMTDADIDYSDIPETKDEDWVGAVRGRFYYSTHPQVAEVEFNRPS